MPLARYTVENDVAMKEPDGEFVNYNELVIHLVRTRMLAQDDARKEVLDSLIAEIGCKP